MAAIRFSTGFFGARYSVSGSFSRRAAAHFATYRDCPDTHVHVLPSFITNDSKPSTSGLKSALCIFVAGQSTDGSWRAAARALLLENCVDFVSRFSADASRFASSIKERVRRSPHPLRVLRRRLGSTPFSSRPLRRRPTRPRRMLRRHRLRRIRPHRCCCARPNR